MKNLGLKIAILLTSAYWFWESKAEGNIRIDLLIIFPILTITYIFALWRKFKFWSVLIALGFMGLNYLYSQYSYSLFDKYPG
jgi:hypothetical protein